MVVSSGGRKGKSCNQDEAREGASDVFGEVLFLDLGNGYRSLPYNNSLNYAFFVQVLYVVYVRVCILSLDLLLFVEQRKR